MLRFIVFIFIISSGVSAGDLPANFDPIPGVNISDNQIVVRDGMLQGLAQEYALVQLAVSTNTGAVTSSIHDPGGQISLPDSVDFIVTTTAAGTAYQASVKDQKNWKTLIAASQKNEAAEVLSVGNFQVDARDNEIRSVRAVGNKITYQNVESESDL